MVVVECIGLRIVTAHIKQSLYCHNQGSTAPSLMLATILVLPEAMLVVQVKTHVHTMTGSGLLTRKMSRRGWVMWAVSSVELTQW